jgi:hypothetical protein
LAGQKYVVMYLSVHQTHIVSNYTFRKHLSCLLKCFSSMIFYYYDAGSTLLKLLEEQYVKHLLLRCFHVEGVAWYTAVTNTRNEVVTAGWWGLTRNETEGKPEAKTDKVNQKRGKRYGSSKPEIFSDAVDRRGWLIVDHWTIKLF